MCVCVRACVLACVRAFVRACVHVHVLVCVQGEEGRACVEGIECSKSEATNKYVCVSVCKCV